MNRASTAKADRVGADLPAAALWAMALGVAAAVWAGQAAGTPASAPAGAKATRPAAEPASAPVDPAAALLAEAWDHVEHVNYPAAQEAFEKVEEALRGRAARAQRAEALYGLGHLWQYRRPGTDISKAKALYRRAAEEFGDTPCGPLALMALARLADAPEYERDRDRDGARKLYRQILARHPGTFVADEAVLRLALTYLEDPGDRKAEEAGIGMLAGHLDSRPGNFLAAAMHMQLGSVYQGRGEFQKAVDHWIAADAADAQAAEAELTPQQRDLPPERRADRISQNRVMDRSTRAAVYFRIAKVAEKKLRDYGLAVQWYERIVYEIQRDNKYYVSKLSAERCRKLAKEAGLEVPARLPAGEEVRP
jgi:tetratricopeptide (TPR) repeat protein